MSGRVDCGEKAAYEVVCVSQRCTHRLHAAYTRERRPAYALGGSVTEAPVGRYCGHLEGDTG